MKTYLLIYLKGLLMGIADIIPGVSGGTIAFITGIYEQLIASINAIPANLPHLLRGRWKAFGQGVNVFFLVALVVGIVSGMAIFAKMIGGIVNTPYESKEKVLLWAFFSGLILATFIYIFRTIKEKKRFINYILFVVGILMIIWLSNMEPALEKDSMPYIFIVAFCAICAMVLPGISGAFILLLLGAYGTVLSVISGFISGLKEGDVELIMQNLTFISVFVAGAVVGLFSFCRLLTWLFKNYHDLILSLLSGVLLGSLYKIWPWKQTTQFRINSHGEEVPLLQVNISPYTFASQHNGENYIGWAVLVFLVGFTVGLVFELIGKKKEV